MLSGRFANLRLWSICFRTRTRTQYDRPVLLLERQCFVLLEAESIIPLRFGRVVFWLRAVSIGRDGRMDWDLRLSSTLGFQ